MSVRALVGMAPKKPNLFAVKGCEWDFSYIQ